MAARRFFRLVPHLHAYGGAVAAALSCLEGEPAPMAAPIAPTPGPAVPGGARVIGATAAELGMSDIGDLFSHGVSGG